VGADYSQIELRILAAMCGDKQLKQAFQRGEDIHAITAKEIFGSSDSEFRRKAKAINFGILYGKSAFSLGDELGIPRGEAAEIIAKYFDRYPTVKRFLEGLAESAKKTGYAETAFGRRRRIEGIDAKNKMILAMAERMAVNTPLQGTAADLIKIAMVKLHKRLDAEGFKARLILQVHDELVVESPEDEVERVKVVVRESMESAAGDRFDVPFTVEVGVADNWLGL
jgi:DNA polymerase-1